MGKDLEDDFWRKCWAWKGWTGEAEEGGEVGSVCSPVPVTGGSCSGGSVVKAQQ